METAQALVMNWRSAALGLLAVCTLVTLARLYRQAVERTAIVWLSGFVLAGLISAVPMVIGFAGAYDRWPGLTFLPVQLAPFFGPLLYFHARTLMSGSVPARHYWLLAPGVCYWLYQCWAFLFLGDYRAKWAFNDAVHEPVIFPLVFLGSFVLVTASLFVVRRMQKDYVSWLERHRSDDDDFHPVWLTQILLFGSPLLAIWTLDYLLGQAFDLSYQHRFWTDFAALFLLFSLSLEALTRLGRPYPKMETDRPMTDAIKSDDEPLVRSWDAEGAALRRAAEENEWFLQPRLSLADLARKQGTNQAYVSRALNSGLGMSFSEFVNQMRVEYAKRLIERGGSSMLEVALSSGFGSKASFHRAFGKFAGLTPRAYRRRATDLDTKKVSDPENTPS